MKAPVGSNPHLPRGLWMVSEWFMVHLTRNQPCGESPLAGTFNPSPIRLFMVDVAQPVERLAVTQEVVGSSPIVHP